MTPNSHHRLSRSSSFEKPRVSESVNWFYRILVSTLICLVSIRKQAEFIPRKLSTMVLEARKVVRSSSSWRTSWWKSIPRGRDLLLVRSYRNEHGIVLGTKVLGSGNFNWPAAAKNSQLHIRNVKVSNSFLGISFRIS